MDMTLISQIFEGLKQIAVSNAGWLGGASGVLLVVYGVYQKYQAVISRIMLRVQKDSADGTWTDAEKEQEAVDIYFNEIIPLIPVPLILVKIIISRRFIMEPLIRKIVRVICAQAAKIQKRVG